MFTWQTRVQEVRKTSYFSDINDVMKEHDCDEASKAECDMEIQSEEFGFDRTLSIEGINCEYHDKY